MKQYKTNISYDDFFPKTMARLARERLTSQLELAHYS
jgi:hypothetical protein